MKLIEIKLDNFRSFYGGNIMDFGDEGERNVTIVHAENHTGKTNFVDAFRWALYGKITGEQKKQIVNDSAFAEKTAGDTLKASVTVTFMHENKRYEVCRTIEVKKIDKDSQEKLSEKATVYITGEDGVKKESFKPTAVIENILPAGMDQYFFLAGENLIQLGQENSQDKIKDAIKILMGLEIIDRSIRHLKGDVRKSLKADKAKHETGNEKKLEAEKDKLDEQVDACENAIEENKKGLGILKVELGEVNKSLKDGEKTRGLQEEKERLTRQRDDLLATLESTETHLMKTCSRNGYKAFSRKAILETEKILKEKRVKGELPANVRYQYVLDLLDEGKCICKRDLIEGEAPYKAVESLKNPDAKTEYENATNEVGNVVKSFLKEFERFPSDLKRICKERVQKKEQLAVIRDKIEEIENQYDGKDFEDQRKLIDRQKEIEKRIKECEKIIIENEYKEKELEKLIDEKKKEIEKIETTNIQHAIAREREKVCEGAIHFLVDLHKALIHRDREVLSERMNKIFKEIIREETFIELTNDFEMIVKKITEDGGIRILPRSGAQSQITSLAFIASIIITAKENLDKGSKFFCRGGKYPLVLDSPFGTMAPPYRKKVSEKLPHFAEQIVILVAQQQWGPEIEQGLGKNINKRYYFHHYTSKESEAIKYPINGKEYTLSEYTDGKEKTIIREVS